ncbi:MAG: SpoIIE family protein phosphatase [Kofleriaceae bacterium]|nr:SpoIIE family protein phosphatase [Kofleriaceae bacterium]
MFDLAWNWLCVPYLACAVVLLAVIVSGALIRGDHVMRLGVVGAAMTTLPWATCSAVSACATDPDASARLLRLGLGPVALIGPNLLFVLLGLSGQLERFRWLARLAGGIGMLLMTLCWATDWMLPGVQRIPSGIWYTRSGPLTGLHVSQLAVWLGAGIFVIRRSTTRGEKARLVRLMLWLLALGAVGSLDMLLVHGIWGSYPVAWLPALIAGCVALYMVVRTDLLRPRGFDAGVLIEVITLLVAAVVVGVITYMLEGSQPLVIAAVASIAWAGALVAAWTIASFRPARVARDRALDELVSRLADVEDEREIADRMKPMLANLAVIVRAVWRTEGDVLVEITTGERWALDRACTSWLVKHGQPLAPSDLLTMRLGELRPALQDMVKAHHASLLVPLIDRDELVGLVEADRDEVLREDERRLVTDAARAAARALTYAALAREATREGALAREVEVAEAMRLQLATSRDDELGAWTVAAAYRTALKTTGAGWSTTLLPDGRLALLVTEARVQGVPAALATSALSGAFAAATTHAPELRLDQLLASLRASDDGVTRGGEQVAAFVALLDPTNHTIEWACAGHPGGALVGPVAFDLEAFPQGSSAGVRAQATTLRGRGQAPLLADALLVVTSTAVREPNDDRWATVLREHAPAGARLATVLLDDAMKRGKADEDFLAVVVRQRPVG